MKPDLNKLKEVLKTYENERWKLSNIIRQLEDVPKMKASVGKYFKYQNSYNVNEMWWSYFYVKEYKKDYLIVDYLEEDNRGKIEIMFDKKEYGLMFYKNPRYIEITKNEYNVAVKKILNKVKKNFKL